MASYLDAHIALRLAEGLKIFALVEADGRELFVACLDGMVPGADLIKLYNVLFPAPADPLLPVGDEPVPEREVKCAVRTSYKGLIDGRLGTPPGSAPDSEGPAHFPALVVDLVDEKSEGGIGSNASSRGEKRLHKYEGTVEIMAVAQTKHEVRALHVLVQEMLIDSIDYFKALGYIGGIRMVPGAGDLRPAEGVMAGLAPNLLGMFQRYQRWAGAVTRSTPRIFTEERVRIARLSLHHVDSIGVGGHPGEASPQPVGVTPPAYEPIDPSAENEE